MELQIMTNALNHGNTQCANKLFYALATTEVDAGQMCVLYAIC